MVRLLVALSAESLGAVGALHSELSHMLCSLLRQDISLIILLLVVDFVRRHLELVATMTLDHAILFAQVDLHSLCFDLRFVLLAKDVFQLRLGNFLLALAALWIFELVVAMLRWFEAQASF